MLSAEDLYDRGVAASRAGRFAAARRALNQALARTEDPDLLARIEVSLAYLDVETGDVDSALDLCRRAAGRDGVGPTTLGQAAGQLGLLLARRGESAEAEAQFGRAIRLLDGDSELTARVHNNRGTLRMHSGDALGAQEDLVRARDLFEAAGNPQGSAKAAFNLGGTYLLLGDLIAALRTMDEVLPTLAELGPLYESVGQGDRAEVLIAAGLLQEGLRVLAETARALGAQRLRQSQAETELAQARSLLHADPAPAVAVARRARRRFEAQGAVAWALRAEAVELMARVGTGISDEATLTQAQGLVGPLAEHRLWQDAQLVELHVIRLHIRRGELDDAARLLRAVRAHDADPVPTRLLISELRGDLARARGRVARSLAHTRRGLADLHAWQASFGSLDLQAGVVGHGRQLAADGLRTAVLGGRPELVFEWSERARTLVTQVAPVRPPGNPEVQAELAELRTLTDTEPDPRSAEGRRAAELRAQIRQHAWFAEEGREVVEPVSLAELQAGLADADAALVAHLAVASQLTALVVTPTGARLIGLGPYEPIMGRVVGIDADLDMAAGSLIGPMRRAVWGSMQARVEALGAELLDPVLPLIGDRRLVLTPSGALAGTPWLLLPGLRGRPVTIPQSATRWLAARANGEPRARADGGDGVVGLVAGPRVERAVDEVARVAASWGSATVLSGPDASCGAVTELAERAQLLHVSAHGKHVTDNPLFSALELADGPWYGYDIDGVVSIPDTVVLSACELGRSSVRAGEEVIGMTAAWLYAGATNVIAATALLNDEVACEVFADVHSRLARGEAPADALAAATHAAADLGPTPLVSFGLGF